MLRFVYAGLWLAALSGLFPAAAQNRSDLAPADLKATIEKSYTYLKSRQNPDGSFAPKLGGPGVTALVVAGLIRSGYGNDDPVVANALKSLESSIKPDGGMYDRGLANYTTSLGVMALKEANKSGRYDAAIANAAKFLKSLQYGDGVEASDPKFGGAGYDGRSRPDTSNTQFLVEALAASGASQDDPAMKRALAFLSRAQNLPGEHNTLPYAAKSTDEDRGGFVYNHLDAGNDKSDKRTAAGGLRSEGGMTYAGLKSFLYAGVAKDDPRVKAALGWIRRHYTLAENPGMGQSGLFYYYHTFAKTMTVLGEDRFEDSKGNKHDWRKELHDTLKAKQQKDGSWSNPNKAFLEDNPDLATAFAVLALSYCK